MLKKNAKKVSLSNFNEEINKLFEKFITSKNKGIANIEETRKSLIIKFDKKIEELYKKRQFISEIFVNKAELIKHKLSVWKKLRQNTFMMNVRCFISMPFIYIMIIPGIVFHLFIEIYHQICFRLYGIPRVKAMEYFVFDRRLLPYLNWFERFNCLYCSYYNCLISYAQEIAGRTERYWCPIKHSVMIKNPHPQYDIFVEYSYAQALRKRWDELRKFETEDSEKK